MSTHGVYCCSVYLTNWCNRSLWTSATRFYFQTSCFFKDRSPQWYSVACSCLTFSHSTIKPFLSTDFLQDSKIESPSSPSNVKGHLLSPGIYIWVFLKGSLGMANREQWCQPHRALSSGSHKQSTILLLLIFPTIECCQTLVSTVIGSVLTIEWASPWLEMSWATVSCAAAALCRGSVCASELSVRP